MKKTSKTIIFDSLQHYIYDIKLPEQQYEDDTLIDVEVTQKYATFLTQGGIVWMLGNVNSEQEKRKEDVMEIAPSQITSLPRISQLSCGKYHAFFLSTQGHLYSYGQDRYNSGVLGLSETKHAKSPQLIQTFTSERITQVSTSDKHAIAINDHGNAFVWGSNSCGQLGLENTKKATYPQYLGLIEVYTNKKIIACPSQSVFITKGEKLFIIGQQINFGMKSSQERQYSIISVQQIIPKSNKDTFFSDYIYIDENLQVSLTAHGELYIINKWLQCLLVSGSYKLEQVSASKNAIYGITEYGELLEWDILAFKKLPFIQNQKSFPIEVSAPNIYQLNQKLESAKFVNNRNSRKVAITYKIKQSKASRRQNCGSLPPQNTSGLFDGFIPQEHSGCKNLLDSYFRASHAPNRSPSPDGSYIFDLDFLSRNNILNQSNNTSFNKSPFRESPNRTGFKRFSPNRQFFSQLNSRSSSKNNEERRFNNMPSYKKSQVNLANINQGIFGQSLNPYQQSNSKSNAIPSTYIFGNQFSESVSRKVSIDSAISSIPKSSQKPLSFHQNNTLLKNNHSEELFQNSIKDSYNKQLNNVFGQSISRNSSNQQRTNEGIQRIQNILRNTPQKNKSPGLKYQQQPEPQKINLQPRNNVNKNSFLDEQFNQQFEQNLEKIKQISSGQKEGKKGNENVRGRQLQRNNNFIEKWNQLKPQSQNQSPRQIIALDTQNNNNNKFQFLNDILNEKNEGIKRRQPSTYNSNILPKDILQEMREVEEELKDLEKLENSNDNNRNQNFSKDRFTNNPDSFLFPGTRGASLNNSQNSSFYNQMNQLGGQRNQGFSAQHSNPLQNINDINGYIRKSQNDIDQIHRQQIAFEEQLEREGSPNRVIRIFSDEEDQEEHNDDQSNLKSRYIRQGGIELLNQNAKRKEEKKIEAIKDQISQLLNNLQPFNSNGNSSSNNPSSRISTGRRGTNAPYQSFNNSPSFGQSRQNSQNQRVQQEKINRIRDKINLIQKLKNTPQEQAGINQMNQIHQQQYMKNKSRSNYAESTTYRDEEKEFDMSSLQPASMIQSPSSSNFLSPQGTGSPSQPYFMSQKFQNQNFNLNQRNDQKRANEFYQKNNSMQNSSFLKQSQGENYLNQDEEILEEPLETIVSLKERRDTVEPELQAFQYKGEKNKNTHLNNQYLQFVSRKGSFQDSAPVHQLMSQEEIKQQQLQQQQFMQQSMSNSSFNVGTIIDGTDANEEQFNQIHNPMQDPRLGQIDNYRKQSSFWSDIEKPLENQSKKDFKKILDEDISGFNQDNITDKTAEMMIQGIGGNSNSNNTPYGNNPAFLKQASQNFDENSSVNNNFGFSRNEQHKLSLQPHSFIKNTYLGDQEDQDYSENKIYNEENSSNVKGLQSSFLNIKQGNNPQNLQSTQYQTQISSFPMSSQGESNLGSSSNTGFNLRQAFTQFLNSENPDNNTTDATPRKIEKKIEELKTKLKSSTPGGARNKSSSQQSTNIINSQQAQSEQQTQSNSNQKPNNESLQLPSIGNQQQGKNENSDNKKQSQENQQTSEEKNQNQNPQISNGVSDITSSGTKQAFQENSFKQKLNPFQVSGINPLNLSGENLNSDRHHHSVSNQNQRELFRDEEDSQNLTASLNDNRSSLNFPNKSQDMPLKATNQQIYEKPQDKNDQNPLRQEEEENEEIIKQNKLRQELETQSKLQEQQLLKQLQEKEQIKQQQEQELLKQQQQEQELLKQLQEQEQLIQLNKKQQKCASLALKLDKLVLKRTYYSFKRICDNSNEQKLKQEEIKKEERRLVKQREQANNIFRKLQQISKLRKQEAFQQIQKLAQNNDYRNKQFQRILENVFKQFKQRQYFEFFVNCQQSKVYIRGQYINALQKNGDHLDKIVQRHLQKRFLLRWKKNSKSLALLLKQIQLNKNIFNLTLNNFSKILKSKVITRLNQTFDKLRYYSDMVEAQRLHYEQQMLLEKQQEEIFKLEQLKNLNSNFEFEIDQEPEYVKSREEQLKENEQDNQRDFLNLNDELTEYQNNQQTMQTAPFTTVEERQREKYEENVQDEKDDDLESEYSNERQDTLNNQQILPNQQNKQGQASENEYSLPNNVKENDNLLKQQIEDENNREINSQGSFNILTEDKSGNNSQIYDVSNSSGSKNHLDQEDQDSIKNQDLDKSKSVPHSNENQNNNQNANAQQIEESDEYNNQPGKKSKNLNQINTNDVEINQQNNNSSNNEESIPKIIIGEQVYSFQDKQQKEISNLDKSRIDQEKQEDRQKALEQNQFSVKEDIKNDQQTYNSNGENQIQNKNEMNQEQVNSQQLNTSFKNQDQLPQIIIGDQTISFEGKQDNQILNQDKSKHEQQKKDEIQDKPEQNQFTINQDIINNQQISSPDEEIQKQDKKSDQLFETLSGTNIKNHQLPQIIIGDKTISFEEKQDNQILNQDKSKNEEQKKDEIQDKPEQNQITINQDIINNQQISSKGEETQKQDNKSDQLFETLCGINIKNQQELQEPQQLQQNPQKQEESNKNITSFNQQQQIQQNNNSINNDIDVFNKNNQQISCYNEEMQKQDIRPDQLFEILSGNNIKNQLELQEPEQIQQNPQKQEENYKRITQNSQQQQIEQGKNSINNDKDIFNKSNDEISSDNEEKKKQDKKSDLLFEIQSDSNIKNQQELQEPEQLQQIPQKEEENNKVSTQLSQQQQIQQDKNLINDVFNKSSDEISSYDEENKKQDNKSDQLFETLSSNNIKNQLELQEPRKQQYNPQTQEENNKNITQLSQQQQIQQDNNSINNDKDVFSKSNDDLNTSKEQQIQLNLDGQQEKKQIQQFVNVEEQNSNVQQNDLLNNQQLNKSQIQENDQVMSKQSSKEDLNSNIENNQFSPNTSLKQQINQQANPNNISQQSLNNASFQEGDKSQDNQNQISCRSVKWDEFSDYKEDQSDISKNPIISRQNLNDDQFNNQAEKEEKQNNDKCMSGNILNNISFPQQTEDNQKQGSNLQIKNNSEDNLSELNSQEILEVQDSQSLNIKIEQSNQNELEINQNDKVLNQQQQDQNLISQSRGNQIQKSDETSGFNESDSNLKIMDNKQNFSRAEEDQNQKENPNFKNLEMNDQKIIDESSNSRDEQQLNRSAENIQQGLKNQLNNNQESNEKDVELKSSDQNQLQQNNSQQLIQKSSGLNQLEQFQDPLEINQLEKQVLLNDEDQTNQKKIIVEDSQKPQNVSQEQGQGEKSNTEQNLSSKNQFNNELRQFDQQIETKQNQKSKPNLENGDSEELDQNQLNQSDSKQQIQVDQFNIIQQEDLQDKIKNLNSDVVNSNNQSISSLSNLNEQIKELQEKEDQSLKKDISESQNIQSNKSISQSNLSPEREHLENDLDNQQLQQINHTSDDTCNITGDMKLTQQSVSQVQYSNNRIPSFNSVDNQIFKDEEDQPEQKSERISGNRVESPESQKIQNSKSDDAFYSIQSNNLQNQSSSNQYFTAEGGPLEYRKSSTSINSQNLIRNIDVQEKMDSRDELEQIEEENPTPNNSNLGSRILGSPKQQHLQAYEQQFELQHEISSSQKKEREIANRDLPSNISSQQVSPSNKNDYQKGCSQQQNLQASEQQFELQHEISSSQNKEGEITSRDLPTNISSLQVSPSKKNNQNLNFQMGSPKQQNLQTKLEQQLELQPKMNSSENKEGEIVNRDFHANISSQQVSPSNKNDNQKGSPKQQHLQAFEHQLEQQYEISSSYNKEGEIANRDLPSNITSLQVSPSSKNDQNLNFQKSSPQLQNLQASEQQFELQHEISSSQNKEGEITSRDLPSNISSLQVSPSNKNDQILKFQKNLVGSSSSVPSHFVPEASEDDQRLLDSELRDQVLDNLVTNIDYIKQKSQQTQNLKDGIAEFSTEVHLDPYQLAQSFMPQENKTLEQSSSDQRANNLSKIVKEIENQNMQQEEEENQFNQGSISTQSQQNVKKFDALMKQMQEQEKIFNDQEVIKFTEENEDGSITQSMQGQLQQSISNSIQNSHLTQDEKLKSSDTEVQNYSQQELNNSNQDANKFSSFFTQDTTQNPEKQKQILDAQNEISQLLEIDNLPQYQEKQINLSEEQIKQAQNWLHNNPSKTIQEYIEEIVKCRQPGLQQKISSDQDENNNQQIQDFDKNNEVDDWLNLSKKKKQNRSQFQEQQQMSFEKYQKLYSSESNQTPKKQKVKEDFSSHQDQEPVTQFNSEVSEQLKRQPTSSEQKRQDLDLKEQSMNIHDLLQSNGQKFQELLLNQSQDGEILPLDKQVIFDRKPLEQLLNNQTPSQETQQNQEQDEILTQSSHQEKECISSNESYDKSQDLIEQDQQNESKDKEFQITDAKDYLRDLYSFVNIAEYKEKQNKKKIADKYSPKDLQKLTEQSQEFTVQSQEITIQSSQDEINMKNISNKRKSNFQYSGSDEDKDQESLEKINLEKKQSFNKDNSRKTQKKQFDEDFLEQNDKQYQEFTSEKKSKSKSSRSIASISKVEVTKYLNDLFQNCNFSETDNEDSADQSIQNDDSVDISSQQNQNANDKTQNNSKQANQYNSISTNSIDQLEANSYLQDVYANIKISQVKIEVSNNLESQQQNELKIQEKDEEDKSSYNLQIKNLDLPKSTNSQSKQDTDNQFQQNQQRASQEDKIKDQVKEDQIIQHEQNQEETSENNLEKSNNIQSLNQSRDEEEKLSNDNLPINIQDKQQTQQSFQDLKRENETMNKEEQSQNLVNNNQIPDQDRNNLKQLDSPQIEQNKSQNEKALLSSEVIEEQTLPRQDQGQDELQAKEEKIQKSLDDKQGKDKFEDNTQNKNNDQISSQKDKKNTLNLQNYEGIQEEEISKKNENQFNELNKRNELKPNSSSSLPSVNKLDIDGYINDVYKNCKISQLELGEQVEEQKNNQMSLNQLEEEDQHLNKDIQGLSFNQIDVNSYLNEIYKNSKLSQIELEQLQQNYLQSSNQLDGEAKTKNQGGSSFNQIDAKNDISQINKNSKLSQLELEKPQKSSQLTQSELDKDAKIQNQVAPSFNQIDAENYVGQIYKNCKLSQLEIEQPNNQLSSNQLGQDSKNNNQGVPSFNKVDVEDYISEVYKNSKLSQQDLAQQQQNSQRSLNQVDQQDKALINNDNYGSSFNYHADNYINEIQKSNKLSQIQLESQNNVQNIKQEQRQDQEISQAQQQLPYLKENLDLELNKEKQTENYENSKESASLKVQFGRLNINKYLESTSPELQSPYRQSILNPLIYQESIQSVDQNIQSEQQPKDVSLAINNENETNEVQDLRNKENESQQHQQNQLTDYLSGYEDQKYLPEKNQQSTNRTNQRQQCEIIPISSAKPDREQVFLEIQRLNQVVIDKQENMSSQQQPQNQLQSSFSSESQQQSNVIKQNVPEQIQQYITNQSLLANNRDEIFENNSSLQIRNKKENQNDKEQQPKDTIDQILQKYSSLRSLNSLDSRQQSSATPNEIQQQIPNQSISANYMNEISENNSSSQIRNQKEDQNNKQQHEDAIDQILQKYSSLNSLKSLNNLEPIQQSSAITNENQKQQIPQDTDNTDLKKFKNKQSQDLHIQNLDNQDKITNKNMLNQVQYVSNQKDPIDDILQKFQGSVLLDNKQNTSEDTIKKFNQSEIDEFIKKHNVGQGIEQQYTNTQNQVFKQNPLQQANQIMKQGQVEFILQKYATKNNQLTQELAIGKEADSQQKSDIIDQILQKHKSSQQINDSFYRQSPEKVVQGQEQSINQEQFLNLQYQTETIDDLIMKHQSQKNQEMLLNPSNSTFNPSALLANQPQDQGLQNSKLSQQIYSIDRLKDLANQDNQSQTNLLYTFNSDGQGYNPEKQYNNLRKTEYIVNNKVSNDLQQEKDFMSQQKMGILGDEYKREQSGEKYLKTNEAINMIIPQTSYVDNLNKSSDQLDKKKLELSGLIYSNTPEAIQTNLSILKESQSGKDKEGLKHIKPEAVQILEEKINDHLQDQSIIDSYAQRQALQQQIYGIPPQEQVLVNKYYKISPRYSTQSPTNLFQQSISQNTSSPVSQNITPREELKIQQSFSYGGQQQIQNNSDVVDRILHGARLLSPSIGQNNILLDSERNNGGIINTNFLNQSPSSITVSREQSQPNTFRPREQNINQCKDDVKKTENKLPDQQAKRLNDSMQKESSINKLNLPFSDNNQINKSNVTNSFTSIAQPESNYPTGNLVSNISNDNQERNNDNVLGVGNKLQTFGNTNEPDQNSSLSHIGINDYKPMIFRSSNRLDNQNRDDSQNQDQKQVSLNNSYQIMQDSSYLPVSSTHFGVNSNNNTMNFPISGFNTPANTTIVNLQSNTFLPKSTLNDINQDLKKAKYEKKQNAIDDEEEIEEERKEMPPTISQQNSGYHTRYNSYGSYIPYEIKKPQPSRDQSLESFKASDIMRLNSPQVRQDQQNFLSPKTREQLLQGQQIPNLRNDNKDNTQDYLGSENILDNELNNSQNFPNSSFISHGNVDFLLRPQSQFPNQFAQSPFQDENQNQQQQQYPNFLDNLNSRNQSRDSSFTANFQGQPHFYSQTSSPAKIQSGNQLAYQTTPIQQAQFMHQSAAQTFRPNQYSHSAHHSPHVSRSDFKPTIKQTIIKQQVVSHSTSQILNQSHNSLNSIDSSGNVSVNQAHYASLPPQHPGSVQRLHLTSPVSQTHKISHSQTNINTNVVINSPLVANRALNHSNSQSVIPSQLQNSEQLNTSQSFIKITQLSPVKQVSVIHHSHSNSQISVASGNDNQVIQNLNESVHSNGSSIQTFQPTRNSQEVQKAANKTVIINPQPVSKTVVQQIVDSNNQLIQTNVISQKTTQVSKTPAILCQKDQLPSPQKPLRSQLSNSFSQANLDNSFQRVQMTPASLNRVASSQTLSTNQLPPISQQVSKTPIVVNRTLHEKDIPKI